MRIKLVLIVVLAASVAVFFSSAGRNLEDLILAAEALSPRALDSPSYVTDLELQGLLKASS